MRRFGVVLVIVLVLVGCNGTSTTSTQDEGITQTAIPTAKVALVDIDLEPLLIQSGDLPSGYLAGQVFDIAPRVFSSYPPPVNQINQRFQKDGASVGNITVMLYDQITDRDKAYALSAMDFVKVSEKNPRYEKTIPPVGEKATGLIPPMTFRDGIPLSSASLAFVRCSAFIDITFGELEPGSEMDELIAYAKRLDKRLTPVVC